MDPVTNKTSFESAHVQLKTLSPRVSESFNVRTFDAGHKSSMSRTTLGDDEDDGGHDPKEYLLPYEAGLDLEAQKAELDLAAKAAPLEYTIPLRTKLFYLGTYLLLNLALTIHSKMLLGKVGNRPKINKLLLTLSSFHILSS